MEHIANKPGVLQFSIGDTIYYAVNIGEYIPIILRGKVIQVIQSEKNIKYTIATDEKLECSKSRKVEISNVYPTEQDLKKALIKRFIDNIEKEPCTTLAEKIPSNFGQLTYV